MAVSAGRLRAPNVSKTALTWSRTVYGDSHRVAAIAAVDSPRTSISVISRSRGVSP
jgi:hypothetical protein